jgi:hypothetical protein
MNRHRTIVSIVVPLAGLCAALPASALAGGPLLSGYGGPGAGPQAILGATLINGPGSSGGGSGGGGSSSAAGGLGGAGAVTGGSRTAQDIGAGVGTRGSAATRGHGAPRGRRSDAARADTATHPRAAGANPNSSHLGASTTVITSGSAAGWFSGADLLALLLAAAALAATALATVRLTRTEHD